MLKIFLNTIEAFHRRLAQLQAIEDYANEQERWRHDPLSHPDIAAMSPRELADLPFRQRTGVCGC